MDQDIPSAWVRRFAPLIRAGGRVLDLAAGGGRHTRLLLDMGFAVTAVDRDVAGLRPLAGERCEIRSMDLEAGDLEAGDLAADAPQTALAQLGDGWDGIVVTNYLHRPLLTPIAAVLAPGGFLIYETFAANSSKPSRHCRSSRSSKAK